MEYEVKHHTGLNAMNVNVAHWPAATETTLVNTEQGSHLLPLGRQIKREGEKERKERRRKKEEKKKKKKKKKEEEEEEEEKKK